MIFGNMGDMLGKVSQMKQAFNEIQKELADARFEEDSAGVKVVVSGDLDLKELKLDPKIFELKDPKRIEFLISDAVDKAFSKAKKEAAGRLRKLTGGLSIPGLF